ncbi:type II and III secretion system protein family protein [Faunimonas sp. B44]|uniref:type II and III secretion system protein family protein n=1 Tax=Faunimonas sp. B44 TaxID=3461493 RepID=UPI004043E21F
MIALAPIRTALRAAAFVALGLLATAPAAAQSGSQDYLQLTSNDVVHSRSIRLGINKSAVIELPRPAGDVLVSNPAIADAVLRTSRRLYLIGVKLGQANIFLFDSAGAQIASFDVYVEADLSGLNRLLSEAITDGWVKAEAMNGNIVLRGEVASAASSGRAQEITVGMLQGQSLGTSEEGGTVEKRVVNLLTITGVEQVSLKVTIAEVRREVVKQLGIDTQAFLRRGNIAFGLLNSQTSSFATNPNVGAAGLSWTNGSNSIDATLRALEETQLIRTLAEPTLTAVSGETAEFLAGGEFPVRVCTDNDNNTRTCSIEYKQFGPQLAFTPVVLSAGRISIKVRAEVSEITSIIDTIPVLSARRAETTVELPSGGSFVIGGLIQESTRRTVSGLPVLQKIPVLGALFSSKDFQKDETELVMIVTPYLVKPTTPSKLARPNDGLVMANDAEAIFLGQVNKIYGSARNQRPDAYRGQVGFAFD